VIVSKPRLNDVLELQNKLIDIRAENIGRRAPVDLGVVGDIKATLSALLPLLQQKQDGAHLSQARALC
jgi:thiamine pyrophosphate-dependent acetolactate synthase large subunit-like protein